MNTNTYPITNATLRADAERTRKQSFAGISHSSSIEQDARLYVPAHTEITVDFGPKLGELKFQTGDVPAWSDTVVAAIKRSASYRQKMAERTTKAEPVISYTGRELKKTAQPPLKAVYPKFPQPGLGMA